MLGDVKSPTWVLVTVTAAAGVVLATNLASAGTPKARGAVQVNLGKERAKLAVGTTF